jgi:DNA-binding response OmpR family regulator
LVSGDRLRAERAARAFAARGAALQIAADAAAARRAIAGWRRGAVIIDLGRRPGEGLALAAEIDASDRAVHLFIVGVRDADQARQVRSRASSADLFRAPPGDATVVAGTLAELARHSNAGSKIRTPVQK